MTDLPPACYSPWMKGVYEVSPNLRPFGTDFGNGEMDKKLFQFDREWSRYAESKRRALEEDRGKYVARFNLPQSVEHAVVELAVTRLTEDWPELAQRQPGGLRLKCSDKLIEPSLDSICTFLQEDLAIVVKDDSSDWIAYINVCNPSHWKPTDKIGLSFFDSHTPIPGFEKVNAAARAMVESMVNRGPFVRFVWGLESDDQLNHHPVAPPREDQSIWYGRRFEEGLFVRVERQVLWPLPELSAALFAIRPIVYPAERFRSDQAKWSQLKAAVESMSPEALEYKGIPAGLLMDDYYRGDPNL